MNKSKFAALLGFTCLTLASYGLAASEPDWMQDSASGVDVSISHNGEKWFIGADGKAYHWNGNIWQTHGSHNDFLRIDAGETGAAALTESGLLYITSNKGSWQPTGIRAADVGIGGGQIWLAGVQNKEGKTVTLSGEFKTTGKIDWKPIAGSLSYVDVDPQGRPWGTDLSGKVYVHTGEKGWIIDRKAPKAADIGAGGNGALYIVGKDIDTKLGGGRVYSRDPVSGEWSEKVGRLASVTVTPDGKAFGVNTLNWVIAGNMDAVEGGNAIKDDEIDAPVIAEGDHTLADIVGDKIPGADKVALKGYKFTDNPEEGWTSAQGQVELNGSPVDGMLYVPHGEAPIIGLKHASVDLGAYVEKIRGSSLGSFGLANAIFFILPDATGDVTYDDQAAMPSPLAGLFEDGEYNGLFPLELKPGVTVIGTWGVDDNKPTDGNVKTILSAFNMSEKGYVIKGHFTSEQLKNPSLTFKQRSSNASSGLKIDKKELCNKVADNAPISGLDLGFSLPDFHVPKTEKSIEFHDAKFTLKEVEGKIEPAILTGVTIKLPEKKVGISDIPMVGKLAVQGNLNIVCNGVTTHTEGQIFIAGSTAFNAGNIEGVAFSSLNKLIETGYEEPKENEAAEDAGVSNEQKELAKKKKDWGWDNPFGTPFLKLRSYAFSGVFDQTGEGENLERTLKVKSFSHAKLDRAELQLFGDMDLKIDRGANALEVENWNFRAPGPIALNDLPLAKDMPYYDEFVLSDIDIGPEDISGTLGWPAKKMNGSAYLKILPKAENAAPNADQEAYLLGRLESLTPAQVSTKFPDAIKNVELTPAIIGFSNAPRLELTSGAMPEKMAKIFGGIMESGEQITIAKGLTLAGKTSPEKILSGQYGDIVTDTIFFGDELTIIGAFEMDEQTGEHKGAFTTTLNEFGLKQIPDSVLDFSESTMSISSLENHNFSVETKASLKVPGLSNPFKLSGSVEYVAESANKNTLSVKLTSEESWNEPFLIPSLEIDNIGFEAEYSKDGNETKKSTAIVGDGTFRGQTGEVKILSDYENGAIENSVVSFVGSLKVSELMDIPATASGIADATFTKLLLSTNAVAGDLTLTLGSKEISGRGAVISDDSGAKALFLRSDEQIQITEIISGIPTPLDQIVLPKGVFVLGSKAVSDFDAGDIPQAIYDEIFDGLVDDARISSLNVTDGLMFLTHLDMDKMPRLIKPITSEVFGLKGMTPVAASIGGIYGGQRSFGFYTVLKDAAPDLPGFVDEFVKFTSTDANIFVNALADSSQIDIGVSSKATLKMRRLDDLSVQELKDTEFSIMYGLSEGKTAVTAGVKLNQEWTDPLGLEGYSLEKPTVEFGQSSSGTVINIHTERAEFDDGGTTRAFSFDMDSTWVSAAPTSLALQLAKVCLGEDVTPGQVESKCEDLTLTPLTLARVQKSIFDLVFRAGSNLKAAVLAGVKVAPTGGDPALETAQSSADALINGFADNLQKASDGMFTLVEKSPLSFIGVRNPVIYFGTPGSTPPSRPDVDRPPLGFGLHVAGDFVLDVAGLKADLASGLYKVNLVDGYLVKGKVTAPNPFASNVFEVLGNMPFLGGPQFLRIDGNLEVPGVSLPGGIGLSIDGNFDVSQGGIMSQSASIAADVTIGGVLHREGSMTLASKTLSFNSPMRCTDIPPLAINGSVNLNNMSPSTISESLISAFKLDVPDPVKCMEDIGKKFKEIGEKGMELVKDPLGSGGELIDNVGDLITDPEGALDNARNLAEMPLNTGEALAGVGISLVTTGVEKIPVLGPGAGKLIGAGFDGVKNLKNMAMNKLKNNQATAWLAEGLGFASGVAGEVLGTVANIGSGMKDAVTGGSSTTIPPSYVNPVVCKPGMQYWNDVFKRCFEINAIVLFDETNRSQNQMGDCIRIDHEDGRKDTVDMHVDKCKGTPQNQFILDSDTNQIKSTSIFYTGYNQWGSNGAQFCMTRLGGGVVKGKRCRHNDVNQSWNYTEDLKLEHYDQCLSRTSENKLIMGSCQNANKWSGLAMAPNWNAVEEVPVRGKITHKASGLCMYWQRGGSGAIGMNIFGIKDSRFSLEPCNLDEGQDYKDVDYIGMHIPLRVLNDDHEVEITASTPWSYVKEYGCLGADFNDGFNIGVKQCSPFETYPKRRWQVQAIDSNSKLIPSGTIPLKEIFKNYDYVFRNQIDKTCLYAEKANPEDGFIANINTAKHCFDRNVVPEAMKFRGYQPDWIAQRVLDSAALDEAHAFRAARLKAKPNLQQWQRYRIRAENARIDAVLKTTNSFRTDVSAILNGRKSPGQCRHGEYWNQNTKSCAQEERMVLKYHNAQGDILGCLRYDRDRHYGVTIFGNCNTYGEHQAFINVISYSFDEQGHIKAATQSNGKDVCLDQDRSFMPIKVPDPSYDPLEDPNFDPEQPPKMVQLARAGFKYCSDKSMTWGYSPSGELVSSDGRCLREVKTGAQKYNIEEARKFDKELRAGYADIDKQYKTQYATELTARLTDMEAFRAPLLADGIVSDDDNEAIGREYERLTKLYKIDVMERDMAADRYALKQQLESQYDFYEEGEQSVVVLANCMMNPMEPNKHRWIPSIGTNYTKAQKLPNTATLSLANDNTKCVSADMRLNGDISMQSCANDNKDQYFALGGVDATRFLISSRNAKTCLYNAGDGQVSHRPCSAGGSELFLKMDAGNNDVKIKNAQSGLCLAEVGADIVQIDCESAPAFKMNAIDDIGSLGFAALNALEIDPERTASAQALWDKAKERAMRMFMGTYLGQGEAILQKSETDLPILAEPDIARLDELPSHINPLTKRYEVLPAIDVPKTGILAVPGFEDGVEHVSFVHARPVEFSNGKPPRTHVSDPYAAHYSDWFLWVHMQKAMRVNDDGTIEFSLIDEGPEFRKAATFIAKPALSGDENKYSFESVLKPGQYLQVQNGALILGAGNPAAASFDWTSTAKWFKNPDLNLMTMEPPLRAPKPPFENWKFPDTPSSVLNKDY